MHEVGMRRDDETAATELGMGYIHSTKSGYENGLPDKQVVPLMGEASEMLPPFKASTGLQPSVPNPYLDQRDAARYYISKRPIWAQA